MIGVYGKLGEPHFEVQSPFLLAIYVVEMTSGTFLRAVNTVVRRGSAIFSRLRVELALKDTCRLCADVRGFF
jgi:hypothetical protein